MLVISVHTNINEPSMFSDQPPTFDNYDFAAAQEFEGSIPVLEVSVERSKSSGLSYYCCIEPSEMNCGGEGH